MTEGRSGRGGDAPREVKLRVEEIVERSGLRGATRSEVRAELLAHFEDGLAAGRGLDEMLSTFGVTADVANLIARERGESLSVADRARNALSSLFRDGRIAWRRLRRRPGFAAIAVLSLAIGIGANTAIFSLVNAILVRDLPYADADRLYDVYLETTGDQYGTFSYPDAVDLREGVGELASAVSITQLLVAQLEPAGAGATNGGSDPAVAMIEAVSGGYFAGLGIVAAVGRTLGPQDDVSPGAHPVVVLGWSYWERAYAGDPGVVGRTIRLSGREYVIVGVAPREFPGTLRGLVPDLFAPILMGNTLSPSDVDPYVERDNHALFVKVRLAEGVPLSSLTTRLSAVAADLHDRDIWEEDVGFRLVRTSEVVVYPPVDRFIRAAAWLLSAVVALVLLIACANLASFLLAKAVDRRRDVAIQLSLGATRGALARQLLIETLALGVVAGGLGLAGSVLALRWLVRSDLPLPLPITLDLSPDATVLGFSLLVSAAAGLAFGLVPAILSTRAQLATVLREESPGGGRRGRVSLRGVLVAAQVAVTLVLLTMAGLLLRSFRATQAVDPGFGDRPSAIVTLSLRSDRWTEEEGLAFVDVLFSRLGAVPGVSGIALTGRLHLDPLNNWSSGIVVDGVDPPPGRDSHVIDWTPVTPTFFDVLGIDLVAGRSFRDSDRKGALEVAIVSQAMAERFWPDGNALGRTFRYSSGREMTIVGVARDTKVRNLGESPPPLFYRPLAQQYTSGFAVVANTTRDAERTAMDLARAARDLDPAIFTWEPKSMERHLATQLLARRMAAWIVSAFATLALLLATIGLYGLVSYSVAQRRQEVGIRMSLGADRGRIVRLLIGGGLRLVTVGVIVGMLLATALAQLLRSLLYGVGALDATTFVGVPLILIAVAFVAAYVPARRATRLDPSIALRAD